MTIVGLQNYIHKYIKSMIFCCRTKLPHPSLKNGAIKESLSFGFWVCDVQKVCVLSRYIIN